MKTFLSEIDKNFVTKMMKNDNLMEGQTKKNPLKQLNFIKNKNKTMNEKTYKV